MVHVHRGSDHGIDSVLFGAPLRLCLFPSCESGSPGLGGAGAGGGFGTGAAWYSVRLLRIREGEWSRRLSFFAGSVSGDSADLLRVLLYSRERTRFGAFRVGRNRGRCLFSSVELARGSHHSIVEVNREYATPRELRHSAGIVRDRRGTADRLAS